MLNLSSFFFYHFHSLLLLVQQVESFPLTLNTRSSHILLEAKDSNCFVLAADQELCVCSLKGALLASFKAHTMPISSICVVGCLLILNSKKYLFTCLYSTVYPLCEKSQPISLHFCRIAFGWWQHLRTSPYECWHGKMTETMGWPWRADTTYWEALTQCPGTVCFNII